MPQLSAAIVAGIDEPEQRTSFIVKIDTTTPRLVTRYRGFTADRQQRGLVIDGQLYKTADVSVPGIEEKDRVGPMSVTISIANSSNVHTELVSNAANTKKRITITKVHFNDDASIAWEGSPASVRGVEPWFEGLTGRPSFRGQYVDIECHADLGRRGKSPRTKSRKLMKHHAPASERQLKVFIAA